MSIDLTPVFQAIIALLAALITYKLIPWIKTKTTTEQQRHLAMAARVAVYAAEQIFGAGTGSQKYDYVKHTLEASGFQLDSTQMKNAIEEAVLELKMIWEPDHTEHQPPDQTERIEIDNLPFVE